MPNTKFTPLAGVRAGSKASKLLKKSIIKKATKRIPKRVPLRPKPGERRFEDYTVELDELGKPIPNSERYDPGASKKRMEKQRKELDRLDSMKKKK